MAQQLDFYIEETKRQEVSGNLELALIAELNSIPQDRNAQVTQTAIQEQTSAKIATETQKCVQQEIATSALPVTSKSVVRKCVTAKTYRRNTAHNWWLALIAFLLFLILILKD